MSLVLVTESEFRKAEPVFRAVMAPFRVPAGAV